MSYSVNGQANKSGMENTKLQTKYESVQKHFQYLKCRSFVMKISKRKKNNTFAVNLFIDS